MIRFSLVPMSLRRRYTIEALLAQDEESDLYLAQPRNGEPSPIALRVYQPGRWLDEGVLDRLVGQPVAGLVGYGRAGSGDGDLPWLVQTHLGTDSLRGLITGEPWNEERTKEAVAAVAALVAEWRAATGQELGDFRPDDLIVTGLEPLTLRLGLIPRPDRYGWSQPPPPESAAGAQDAWWALGVLVHELLTGRPPRFEPGDPAVELGDTGLGRWQHLLAGLLTVDPNARWTGREVAAWLAGGTPAVTPDRVPRPIAFEGREHRTMISLVTHMTAHPADTERWWLNGGDVLLTNWLDLDLADETLDRTLLDTAPPLVLTGLAATYLAGHRPRYRGFAVDAAGLTELAAGESTGHLVLAEAVTSGALAHAARHRCEHRACHSGGFDGCREITRVLTDVPIILGQARDVLDQMRERTGEIAAREWNRGVAVAVQTTLDPASVRRHRRRLRVEGLTSLGKGGPAWVGWWREQRRYALDGRVDELGTRVALMVVVLLTAGADVLGKQLAEENKQEMLRRRDEATDQGRALLARGQEGALTLFGELRRRLPILLRRLALLLMDGGERARAGAKVLRTRARHRYARYQHSRRG
ncbi:hypothetical protein [Acrocarpospora sp. B8E8]|uniref:hypothetical protein n=1 Tax=Acrocarpospora sp. B8E8 TaxID=3153572 RepID=UPI00325DCCEC